MLPLLKNRTDLLFPPSAGPNLLSKPSLLPYLEDLKRLISRPDSRLKKPSSQPLISGRKRRLFPFVSPDPGKKPCPDTPTTKSGLFSGKKPNKLNKSATLDEALDHHLPRISNENGDNPEHDDKGQPKVQRPGSNVPREDHRSVQSPRKQRFMAAQLKFFSFSAKNKLKAKSRITNALPAVLDSTGLDRIRLKIREMQSRAFESPIKVESARLPGGRPNKRTLRAQNSGEISSFRSEPEKEPEKKTDFPAEIPGKRPEISPKSAILEKKPSFSHLMVLFHRKSGL